MTGEIGVFQNTCRHRGMILVDKPQKIQGRDPLPLSQLVLWFGWPALRTTPHVGGPGQNTHDDVDMDETGPDPHPGFYVWRDVIFVNIDGTAPEFAEAHADLSGSVGANSNNPSTTAGRRLQLQAGGCDKLEAGGRELL